MADSKQGSDNFNRGGFIAFLGSMIFSVGFFVYVSVIHPGIDLKEVPEEQGAEQVLGEDGSAGQKAFDISSVDEPWVPSDEVAAHGEKIYQQNCAVCHGPKGLGNGPAGAGLVPKPRNLVEGGWKVGGTSIKLYQTLQNGIEGGSMASFKGIPVKDRWAMVQWIRSITKDKPEDDPEALAKFAETAD